MTYRSIGGAGFGMAMMLAIGACSPSAPDIKAVEADVRDQAAGIVTAFNAHDAVKTASYDAPDYVGMFHGAANVVGPKADQAGMALQLKDPAAKWAMGDGEVTVSASGDLAVYEARYVFTFTNPATGKPIEDRGNWVAIFKRQPDGSMKLWRSIGTDTPIAGR